MIKLLIVAAHRHNRSPSQRFRFEQYYEYFKQNGIEYKLSYIITERDEKYFYSQGFILRKLWILFKAYLKRWRDVFTCGKYDVILIQREAIMTRTTLFERLLAKRKPVIFDFDDAIWKMDVSEANQNLKWMKNPKKTARIIKHSKLVIAGNDYLQNYAKEFNENTIVIPTTVDTDLFKLGIKEKKALTIGWSGSKTTIKHFELATVVLKRIKDQFGDQVTFKVIGEPNYSNEILGIKGLPWNADTEVEDLNSIDIGIMPLPNDEWSKGKCGLKGLTYMALEIPTIMYSIGVNSEIIEDGKNGYLYHTDEELFTYLSNLISDQKLRENIGKAGRKTVEEKYSVLANRDKYINAITSVLKK
jgi:glycosyltransferase involved in cell wall biosynthesis